MEVWRTPKRPLDSPRLLILVAWTSLIQIAISYCCHKPSLTLFKHMRSGIQCCGSMTFWGGSGSGSADPCLRLMDPDSDPDPGSGSWYFRQWPSRCQQKTNFLTQSAYYFLKLHLHYFSKIKSQKDSLDSRNQSFSYYFCMMIEGSGSGSTAGSGSGSIALTSGSVSGSGRPKNTWIRIRIRIRNTAGIITNVFQKHLWLPR